MPKILENPFVASAVVVVAALYLGMIGPGASTPDFLKPVAK